MQKQREEAFLTLKKPNLMSGFVTLATQNSLLLQFKWTASSADVEFWTVLTFGWRVFSLPNVVAQWMVPDVAPLVGENVPYGFKVGLARENVAVGLDAEGDTSRAATFYPEPK